VEKVGRKQEGEGKNGEKKHKKGTGKERMEDRKKRTIVSFAVHINDTCSLNDSTLKRANP